MWTWTPESRRWYAEAAAVSGYHAALAAAMAPWLSPSWDVADMGCGLGFLSLAVAPLVRSVTALDTDRDVLESLAARASEASAGNVRPKLCDVLSGNFHGRFDAVICSFFGRPGRDAADFLSHAGRVLAVVRRHSSPSIAPGADHRGGEDDASVREALSASGIPFSARDMDIEFGQPFADRDEAMAFLAHYDRGRRTPEERSARPAPCTCRIPRKSLLSSIPFRPGRSPELSPDAGLKEGWQEPFRRCLLCFTLFPFPCVLPLPFLPRRLPMPQ